MMVRTSLWTGARGARKNKKPLLRISKQGLQLGAFSGLSSAPVGGTLSERDHRKRVKAIQVAEIKRSIVLRATFTESSE
jgi:hypothetical protein